MEEKCKKAVRLLFKARKAVGKDWGLSLATTKWIYEAIVRPSVLYCSIVWGHKVNQSVRPLVRVQRLALLMLGHFLPSTPTAALEAMFGYPPLDILARQEAILAATRLEAGVGQGWDGIGANGRRGHLQVLNALSPLSGEAVSDRLSLTWDWPVSYTHLTLPTTPYV